MPEVTFYVLNSESLYDRYFFACRLIEKAYNNGKFCYVLLDSIEQCQRLDDMLWTFRAGSFIPHQIFTGTSPEITTQILIGTLNAPPDWQNVVFNLSSQLPQAWQQTARVLEILDNSETTKIAGRERYRTYKQTGVEIMTHHI
ncbi:MAG: DNA polymerase III subunit chi [Methylococcales bacterium]|nr:DNA polymerase III subunit chi [Methylococcales bacterium]MDD5753527.1 DNA polymerase III subunit chi [Methylococcales bacterium]